MAMSLGREIPFAVNRWKCENIPVFEAEPTTLAWLESSTSQGIRDSVSLNDLKSVFPWLWDPFWSESVHVGEEGVKKIKDAVVRTERMVKSLEGFLSCSKNRLDRLRKDLKVLAAKCYFSYLSDDILAVIFEFASFGKVKSHGETKAKPDYRTPLSISHVSRKFRNIALNLPRLWRCLSSEVHSLATVEALTSRCADAGPILEVRMCCKRLTRDQAKQAEDHVLFFCNVTMSFASQITSLQFDYYMGYGFMAVEKLSDGRFKNLSLPALRILRINYDNSMPDGRYRYDVHFYQNWDLPCLRVLDATNIIPQLRPDVLGRVTECTLSIGRSQVPGEHDVVWELPKVMSFLGALSAVKKLEVDLHGEHIFARPNTLPTVILPHVETLTTSFVGVEFDSAMEFRSAFIVPNKQSWTIEINDTTDPSLREQLQDIFPMKLPTIRSPPDQRMTPEQLEEVKRILVPTFNHGLYHTLKEVNLIIHRDFGRKDCDDIRRSIPLVARTLENLSISYPNGEQGFFGGKDFPDCQVQVRKVEFKNCRGIEHLMQSLEGQFEKAPWEGNARLVLDGSDIRVCDEESSFWDSLVRNAKIVRE